MTDLATPPVATTARCRHCNVPLLIELDDAGRPDRVVHADGFVFCDHTERTRAAFTDDELVAAAAGLAAARRRLDDASCPGGGQLVFRDQQRGSARCAHCREEVATERTPRHGVPTLVAHTAPARRRACRHCGEPTPSSMHHYCSTFCHRLDAPDEYDDRDIEA